MSTRFFWQVQDENRCVTLKFGNLPADEFHCPATDPYEHLNISTEVPNAESGEDSNSTSEGHATL